MKIYTVMIIAAMSACTAFGAAFCAEKDWIGAGDAATWADGNNWNPQGEPSSVDDASIDLKDSSVAAEKTFEAKSVVVGGGNESQFSTQDFIYGNITPASPSDEALYIKKDGTVVLRGNGTITLKGMFKNTEETVTGEESFMFTLD